MQSKSSWLIPSKAEWKAMRWGGLYVLAGYVLLRIFLWPFLLGPFGSYNPWPKPLILLSQVLTDPNSLIMYWRIPSLLASTLCGMLGGLFIYQWLRRKARQRPLTSGDGWLAGAVVGACFGILLAVLYIIAPYGIFPTIRRITQEVPRLSGWGTRQYLNVLLVVAILTLFMAAIGAVLSKLLYGRGIAADTEPEADANARGGERMASGPGCMWLLVVAFFTMYFYGDASHLLSKIPLPHPAFMRTGDFGIISQEPCGPPCFQGITPGVTTIKDAYLNLLKAGAPCRMSESRFEPGAPIQSEGVSCNSGKAYIGIESPIGFGQQRETDEAKVVVNSITLKPPTNVTVGQLLAWYGPPDAVREYTGQESSGSQSYMSFYYDQLQTYVSLTMQPAAAYTVAPDTTIERVSYQTAANYQKTIDQRKDTQPWKGYGTYAMDNAFLSAAVPTMAPGDFGILSQEPCGPPCFHGIRPGVITFDDAASLLQNAGILCTMKEISQGKTLTCNSGDAYVTLATMGFCVTDSTAPMVGGIGLKPPVKITLGEFIAKYGPPDAVMNTGGDALLSYGSLQTFVFVSTQPNQQGLTVTASTTIQSLVYLGSTDYSKCLQIQEQDWQPWKGYVAYAYTPWRQPLSTPALTPTPVATPTSAYSDLSITMEQACGFGCRYRVTIDAEGNVQSERIGPRAILEERTAKITGQQIAELVAAINKAKIWTIEDQQDESCPDCTPVVLSVTLDGRTKHVSRYDTSAAVCGLTHPNTISEAGAALGELGHKIGTIVNPDQWMHPHGNPQAYSTLAITVFTDANGNGWPQSSEGLGGIPVQLIPADGAKLSGTTNPWGLVEFDMTGYPSGIEITANAPSIGQSYCFYLPGYSTVPIYFNVAPK